jgi:DNA processing protein
MNTLEGRAWQALAAVKGMGPKALWTIADYLFSRQRTASWLLRNPDQARAALGGRWAGIALPDPDLLNTGEEGSAEEQEVTVLHPLHLRFPGRVKRLKDRLPLPAMLYATGNVSLLERPGVAIVGKRSAGKEALAVTGDLASALAARGINVTSGYAAGIDSAAHRTALQAGGTTIAVLAEGLAHFQVKPELKGLLNDMNALAVSQFPPREKWAAYQAMARNKLVAALAGVLVIIAAGPERDAAGRMSGTFDAGVSALTLGLPVFAVDPDFFKENAAGNRELIKRGCVSWSPAAGITAILQALDSPPKPAGQKKLF